jgi:hypothetical protein
VADHGEPLGVDLYDLLTAGEADLPAVANVYADAVKKVNDAAGASSHAMSRPEYFGADPVLPAWTTLKDIALGFLSQTQKNVTDTGTAVVMAVGLYAYHDTAARDKLNSLRQVYGEPHP